MAYEPFVAFGTRKGFVFELDAYGIPKPTSVTPYLGLDIYGIRAFELTPPEPRNIPHFNGDRVELVQSFPSLDAPAGSITVDGNDLNLASILAAVKKSTVSGMELMPFLSDQQGAEPSVGLMVYQAAKKSTGVVGYHVQFIASTTMIPRPGPMGDSNFETRYSLAPNAVASHLWGFALGSVLDGVTKAGVIDGWALYKPRVTTFLADGVATIFTFDVNNKPTDNTYAVYKSIAGVVTEQTAGVTKTTTTLTITGPLAIGTTILVPHMTA